MNMQAELNFDLAQPDVKRLVDMVRTIMKDGNWYMPWELCEQIKMNLNIRVSDSSITARIRELRRKAIRRSHSPYPAAKWLTRF